MQPLYTIRNTSTLMPKDVYAKMLPATALVTAKILKITQMSVSRKW